MITTTLRRIRSHRPCGIDPRKTPLTGYQKLKAGLGLGWRNDDPIPFSRILEINGFADALWCCRAEPQYAREWRLFMVWCARQVQHLMSDPHSIAALDVAERYANGQATMAELKDADAAAWSAARSAAWSAARADQTAEFLRIVNETEART